VLQEQSQDDILAMSYVPNDERLALHRLQSRVVLNVSRSVRHAMTHWKPAEESIGSPNVTQNQPRGLALWLR
jgi:hypothetical protein